MLCVEGRLLEREVYDRKDQPMIFLSLWRGRLLQGEVHDDNAFALGGIAWHAGFFGTAKAVGQVTHVWREG